MHTLLCCLPCSSLYCINIIVLMNPCKCGYYPNMEKCTCSALQIKQYRSKISQPLLDRIDICVEIYPVSFQEWFGSKKGESSEEIRKRVIKARKIQEQRYKLLDYRTNSGLKASDMERFCPLGEEESELMKQAFIQLELSGRGYHRILKVARTIADLEGSNSIRVSHLSEAICYRSVELR